MKDCAQILSGVSSAHEPGGTMHIIRSDVNFVVGATGIVVHAPRLKGGLRLTK